MATWVINGSSQTAQQVVNAPTCKERGKCVVISNNSTADTLYLSTDRAELETAKGNGLSTVGIPLLAGEKIVIPWVTSAIFAINYNAGATPSDQLSAVDWE